MIARLLAWLSGDARVAPLTPTTRALIKENERLRADRSDLLGEVERLRAEHGRRL